MNGRTIVFIHGAWVTAASWDSFRRPFELTGWTVLTPTWPGLEGLGAAEINAAPPAGLGSLSVEAIVEHLADFVAALPEPPVLLGHSFGGLFVQKLLDRGLGRAGVALNPAPIGGVVYGPTTLTAALPIILRPGGWRRPYPFSRQRFFRRFANVSRAHADAAFDRYVIPAPGRIFYDAAFWQGTGVQAQRRTAPLLITEGDRDRLVTPHVSRAAWRIQRASSAPTDYLRFAGRSHLLIDEPGWEVVAAACLDWIEALPAFSGSKSSPFREKAAA